jgi:predicted metal-dependent phosphoesterase TrpH
MSLIRGYLHLHSRHSYDGKLTLQEIKEKCLELEMSFVAITEHTDGMDNQAAQRVVDDCRLLSNDHFQCIPGFELPYKNCHVLLIGCAAPDLTLDPLDTIKHAKQQGAWIVLAHPHRNHYTIDRELAVLLDGIEIWNQQYDGKHFPRIKDLRMYEHENISNHNLLATAGLDMHRVSHFGGPYIKLSPAEFLEKAILDQLRSGQYEVERGSVRFDSRPELKGFTRMTIGLGSFFSTKLIGGGKWIGKWAHEHNVSMPKKFKEAIRKRL